MSKKTIYLHIGTHKTGTTSLQNFLYKNAKLLKKDNYDYLVSNCTWCAHHALGWSFQGATQPISEYCSWSNYGVINYLEDEIKNSPCDNFIISSENLYQLKNMEFIKRFFDRFSQFEIKLILYLRNQVSFIESWYYELVRADYFKLNEDIADFIENPRYNIDYSKELEKWKRFIKIENCFILNFHNEAKNGNLINNFCNLIGIKNYISYKIPNNVNEKTTFLQMQMLRKINARNLSHKKWINERDKILKNAKYKIDQKKVLINNSMKNQIEEKYKESNRILLDKYGIIFNE